MTKHYYTKSLLFLLSIILLATSCKKEFSNDDPFPTEFSPSIFVASDNRILYSFDLSTHKKNWEYTADASVKATPVIFGNSIFMISYAGTIYELNKITGELIRERKLTDPVDATPMVYDNKLIVCTNLGKVLALDANDINADPIWQRTGMGAMKASPSVKDYNTYFGTDTVIAICATTTGNVFALNLEDGTTFWTKSFAASGGFVSSPYTSYYTSYACGYNGQVYSLNTLNGNTNWTYTTGGIITASPMSVGGNVMVGSWDRNFYSVDSLTGTLRWKVTTGDKVESSAFYDNQYVYFGSNDQNIYCVDVINGLETWKRRTYGVNRAAPIAFMNKVYGPSWDKNLYIMQAEDGTVENLLDINGLMDCSPVIDNISTVVYPIISGNNWYK